MLQNKLKSKILDNLVALGLWSVIILPIYITTVNSIFEHNQGYLMYVNDAEENLQRLKAIGTISSEQAEKYFKLLISLKNNQKISRVKKFLIVPYIEKSFRTVYLEDSAQCNATIGSQIDGQGCAEKSFTESQLKQHIEQLWSEEVAKNTQCIITIFLKK